MDRQQFFGDSVGRTLVRLVLLSIVVGIIFSVLGITPFNLIDRLEQLIRRILDLGFDAFRSAFGYFLLGAVVVIPAWFIMHAWHCQIEQNEIDVTAGGEPIGEFVEGPGFLHLGVLEGGLQRLAQGAPKQGVVVDNDKFVGGHRCIR